MIEISLTQAVALYALVLGIIAAAVWLYADLSAHRSQRFFEEQYLWRCVYCRYTYLDDDNQAITQCPRCGSYNSNEDAEARFIKVTRAGEAIAAEATHASDEPLPRRNPSRRKKPHQKRRGPRKR